MSVLSYDGSSWETKLQRIGERSAQERELVFNNLGHILDADMLRELYHQLDGSKAVGIDGITKADYGADLVKVKFPTVPRLTILYPTPKRA